MRQFLIKVHLWLSLPVGAVFLLLCLTGSILVFRADVEDWQRMKSLQIEAGKGKMQKLSKLYEAVRTVLPDSLTPGAVTIPSARDKAYSFSIKELRGGEVFVNPYTGEVLEVKKSGNSFFTIIMRLHRWLMIPFKRGEFSTGRFITGVTTLVSTIILITGIIIWIPKSRKGLKHRLTIKRGKGSFRFLYDLHLAGGIYASLFLLVFCLTGLTWSFSWYRNVFYAVFGVKQGEERHSSTLKGGEKKPEHKSAGSLLSDIHWDEALKAVKEQTIGYSSITLDDGMALVVPPNGNRRAANRYVLNRETGEVIEVTRYEDSVPESRKLHLSIYSFHVGSWGGLITKILSFISCIMGVLLSATGYYMYFRKLNHKAKSITIR